MNLFRNYKRPSFALTGNFANYDLLYEKEGRGSRPPRIWYSTEFPTSPITEFFFLFLSFFFFFIL